MYKVTKDHQCSWYGTNFWVPALSLFDGWILCRPVDDTFFSMLTWFFRLCLQFSFRALNEYAESNNSFNGEASNHLSEESRITDCSLLSTFEKIDCERHPDTSKSSLKTGDTSVAISSEVFPPVHAALSPNVLDLLRPSKKNTRECEEVSSL